MSTEVLNGRGAPGALNAFFESWRFPVFMLVVVAAYMAIEITVLLSPPGATGFSAFAEDFRVWCFGYDPATGRMEWGYVAAFLLQPVILGSVIYAFWRRPLREIAARPAAAIPYAAAALLLVAACGAGFAAFASTPNDTELPFPAEELRTALVPPSFALTDHDGAAVRLEDLRGRVVLVTAVYASCGFTCPMIMGQTKNAVGALSEDERAGLTVAAITLDPEHDTSAVLAEMAKGQGVSAPLYRLLTGDAPVVNDLLDRFSVARTRNPETGVIDHANLFILIDRAGRIAYRLSLGDRQERWLISALRLLLSESAGLGV
ncbi:SCO family protein [bacterium]|nr:SCO family protein [bacterium]